MPIDPISHFAIEERATRKVHFGFGRQLVCGAGLPEPLLTSAVDSSVSATVFFDAEDVVFVRCSHAVSDQLGPVRASWRADSETVADPRAAQPEWLVATSRANARKSRPFIG